MEPGEGAYRHHKGLQSLGVESRMLVQNKNTHDDSIMCSGKGPLHWFRARLRNFDLLPLLLYPTRRLDPLVNRMAEKRDCSANRSRKRRSHPFALGLSWVRPDFGGGSIQTTCGLATRRSMGLYGRLPLSSRLLPFPRILRILSPTRVQKRK